MSVCPTCGHDAAPPLGMTQRQRDLLVFLVEYIDESGLSPSYDEMCNALDLASKSGVSRILGGLESRGHIVRLPGSARSVGVSNRGIAVVLGAAE